MIANRTLSLAVLLAAGMAAQAAPPQDAPTGQPADTSAGMRVYIDPETGRFTDKPVTEAQRRAAAEGIATGPLAPMVETRHPDGSVQVDLHGHFEMASMAVIGPDGGLMRVCNDAAHAAMGAHAHPRQAAPTKRDER